MSTMANYKGRIGKVVENNVGRVLVDFDGKRQWCLKDTGSLELFEQQEHTRDILHKHIEDYIKTAAMLDEAKDEIREQERHLKRLQRRLRRQKKAGRRDELRAEIGALKTSLYHLRGKRDRHQAQLDTVVRRLQNAHYEHTKGHVTKVSGKGNRMQAVIKIDGTSYTRHLHRSANGEWWGRSMLQIDMKVRYDVDKPDPDAFWNKALQEAQEKFDRQVNHQQKREPETWL